jgi:hypothetical protein
MDTQLMNEERNIEHLPLVANKDDVVDHPCTKFISVLLDKPNESITNNSKRFSSADIIICDGG